MKPLVRAWLRKNQPWRKDHDDLENAALIALLEAELRFVGTPETWPRFAWPRLIGAILDEIRKDRPYGYRRNPGPIPVIISLDTPLGDSGLVISDTIPDISAIIDHDPVWQQNLRHAISALPVNHRTVIEMRADLDWTLEESAQALGVTVSAVSYRIEEIQVQLLASLEHPMLRVKALRLLRSESHLRLRVGKGRSTREIAEELGVSRSSVREKMKMYGITPIERPSK